MKLSNNELKAIKEYVSACRDSREPKDILSDCRRSVIKILQHFCLHDCGQSKTSKNYKSLWIYLANKQTSFFFGKNKDAKDSYINSKYETYKQIYQKFNFVNKERNESDYQDEDKWEDEAKAVLRDLTNGLWHYFTRLREYDFHKIEGLDSYPLPLLKKIFRIGSQENAISKSEEFFRESIIRQRETYYVLVLVDASSSMLWPFLKEAKNYNDPTSKDYIQALEKTQTAIKKAHQKALEALRGSSICHGGYLKVCQYVFNHENKNLNNPCRLEKDAMDDVKLLTKANYDPDGMTALYDAIEQSTRLIYDNYVKTSLQAMEIDKLIVVVITDGDDTIIGKTPRFILDSNILVEQESYKRLKQERIKQIKELIKKLRGLGSLSHKHLESAVLIGLTNAQFSKEKLEKLKDELLFNEAIAIDQNNASALRSAFKLLSTNALNT